MYISVLPLRKVVMVMMDMVKYCHICCRWDKCIYFVRKTKFQVKFLIYFQNQPWIPSARSSSVPCGLFPVACGRCMEFAEIARPASGCLQCRYLCPAAGRLHRVRFFAIFVCRQTVSVGQFGASVLPIAPAAVIPVGWLRPLRGRGGRREESPGLIHPLRRIPRRGVRRPNRRAGCAPWGSGR